jgi:glycosyltransferase involved in cell wall biosynthesis
VIRPGLPPPKIEGVVPTLSVVVPHWPLDEETSEALRFCVSSFPPECERIVVVNDGTGYGHNVNIGLRLASGDYIAVVNNDCRLTEGDIYDLCVPDTVASPLVIGARQGFGESLEPGGFHGSFWVVSRAVLENAMRETSLRSGAGLTVKGECLSNRRRRPLAAEWREQVIEELVEVSCDEVGFSCHLLAPEPEHPVPEVRIDSGKVVSTWLPGRLVDVRFVDEDQIHLHRPAEHQHPAVLAA